MGRKGWYDEVVRFYDKFLKGTEPSVQDPMIAVQTNDGKWRGEDVWPPADASQFTTTLRPGEYSDTGQSFTTGSDETATSGVWTISKPLPYDVHLSGAGKAVIDVETQFPNANLAVDVYDLDKNGSGPLISRQGHLIRESGKVTLPMMSADWKLPAGHRIGVRVTDTNLEWWLMTLGTQQPVTVKGGTISLPFLRYQRTDQIQGDPGTQLEGYLADKVTVPADLLAESESGSFALPPAMEPRPAAQTTGAGTAPAAAPAPATVTVRSATPAAGRKAAKAKTVKAKLRALKGGRLVLTGTAAKGAKLTIKVRRAGRTIVTRRLTVKNGTFRVTFKLRRSGKYAALITSSGKKYVVRGVKLRK
jgi:hypothetical protein